MEEVLGDLLRVDDDDVLVQKAGVDEVAWGGMKLGEWTRMEGEMYRIFSPIVCRIPRALWG